MPACDRLPSWQSRQPWAPAPSPDARAIAPPRAKMNFRGETKREKERSVIVALIALVAALVALVAALVALVALVAALVALVAALIALVAHQRRSNRAQRRATWPRIVQGVRTCFCGAASDRNIDVVSLRNIGVNCYLTWGGCYAQRMEAGTRRRSRARREGVSIGDAEQLPLLIASTPVRKRKPKRAGRRRRGLVRRTAEGRRCRATTLCTWPRIGRVVLTLLGCSIGREYRRSLVEKYRRLIIASHGAGATPKEWKRAPGGVRGPGEKASASVMPSSCRCSSHQPRCGSASRSGAGRRRRGLVRRTAEGRRCRATTLCTWSYASSVRLGACVAASRTMRSERRRSLPCSARTFASCT